MVLTIIMFSRGYEIEFSKKAAYVRVGNWLWLTWLEDTLILGKFLLLSAPSGSLFHPRILSWV